MKLNTLLALLLAVPMAAKAVEFNWSGFGTAGYAISDNANRYQRFITDRGTFNRDSVFGGQLDVKLSPQFGATIQARLAPAADSDSRWEPSLAWAFLSWRPLDDFLLRAGKLRVPLMLNTENQDVGATYPFVRLPVEVYSTAPTTDIWGVMFSKSWWRADWEWGLDGYYGKINYFQRLHVRDMPQQGGGATWYDPTRLEGGGLVLSLRADEDVYRIGYHRIETRRRQGGIISDLAFTPLPSPPYQPGEGLYDVSSSPQVDATVSQLLTLGASVALPEGFQLTAEYARLLSPDAVNGWNRWSAYAALAKRIGRWTPYGYYAQMQSAGNVLRRYQAVENNNVSIPAPGMAASQHLAADYLIAHDQSTWAVGTAYQLTPRSLLKTEWSQTHTGIVSSFIDAPSGGSSANQRIDVFSVSYSFTF